MIDPLRKADVIDGIEEEIEQGALCFATKNTVGNCQKSAVPQNLHLK